jgi:hypothetical protein
MIFPDAVLVAGCVLSPGPSRRAINGCTGETPLERVTGFGVLLANTACALLLTRPPALIATDRIVDEGSKSASVQELRMDLQGAAALSRMKVATVKFVLEDAGMGTGPEKRHG